MRFLTSLIVFVLSVYYCRAQKQLHIVSSAGNEAAIPEVVVYAKPEKDLLDISDQNGAITIPDSLTRTQLHHISFRDTIYDLSRARDTLYMRPLVGKISEVTVNATGMGAKGHFKKIYDRSYQRYQSNQDSLLYYSYYEGIKNDDDSISMHVGVAKSNKIMGGYANLQTDFHLCDSLYLDTTDVSKQLIESHVVWYDMRAGMIYPQMGGMFFLWGKTLNRTVTEKHIKFFLTDNNANALFKSNRNIHESWEIIVDRDSELIVEVYRRVIRKKELERDSYFRNVEAYYIFDFDKASEFYYPQTIYHKKLGVFEGNRAKEYAKLMYKGNAADYGQLPYKPLQYNYRTILEECAQLLPESGERK